MSDAARAHERLIGRLTRQLTPVRVLASPARRTLLWLGCTLWMAALLSLFADWPQIQQRLLTVPDMAIAESAAILTAGLAALAAFQTSVPGRSPWWACLPLPPLVVWLAASTAGCLRLAPAAGTVPEPLSHPLVCLSFLLLVSLPMAMLLLFMLLRGVALRPELTVLLGGLASAAAAASLLALVHPFDATAEDLLVHLLAICVVVAVTRVAGVAWLRLTDRQPW